MAVGRYRLSAGRTGNGTDTYTVKNLHCVPDYFVVVVVVVECVRNGNGNGNGADELVGALGVGCVRSRVSA